MRKPHITAAAVFAAHDVLDRYVVPDNYHKASKAEQRRIRMAIVREALIAAARADAATASPAPKTLARIP
jgi:hypothetical protein